MFTKKRAQEILSQYKPGFGRQIAKVFGAASQLSVNMTILSNDINRYPGEILSMDYLQQIRTTTLTLEKDKKDETSRIFTLLKEEIDAAILEHQKQQWLYRALQAWTNSYYFDRSHSLVLAINEITPRFSQSTLTRSEHMLGILFLAFSCYGIKYSNYNSIIAGKLTRSCGTLIINSNLPGINRLNNHKAQLEWLIGLGLQIGLGFTSGAGGLFVASYVAGTLLETLSLRLCKKIKSLYTPDIVKRHPNTDLFFQKLLCDMAFCGGSLLGQYVHYRATHAAIEPPKPENNTSENTSSTKNNTHDTHDTDAKQETPLSAITLTDRESSLIFNKRQCSFEANACREIALKVLGLDPKKKNVYTSKDIKNAYKTASLFWHPDKHKNRNETLAQEQMVMVVAANTVLKK